MRSLFLTLAIFLSARSLGLAITIPTVPVNNAGNAADATGYGAVSYDYRIGVTEVTNAQYAAFLNAKAASDPLALYDPNMSSGLGGITRSGIDGSYAYAPIAGRANLPVNYVTWYDAIRFANWMNNGQGNGDTETGAYTLLGGTIVPSNGPSITRNPGATWVLTSENEWYKAAYFNPASNSYFAYPTSSNSVPVAGAPPGGSNSANYNFAVGDLTRVAAYVNSESPYGTFDQGGNVWEWNESLDFGSFRGIRGGAWYDIPAFLQASVRGYGGAGDSGSNLGFRVAIVPEPTTSALLGVALLVLGGLSLRRKRKGDITGSVENLLSPEEHDIVSERLEHQRAALAPVGVGVDRRETKRGHH